MWLQDHAHELTWQLGEAQRQSAEARRERDQFKAEVMQNLETLRKAEACSSQLMHAPALHTALVLHRPATKESYHTEESLGC